MATQAQVLEIVRRDGFYSARLHKFNKGEIRVKGIRAVAPAERLTEKGILTLKQVFEEPVEDGVIIHYTWIAN